MAPKHEINQNHLINYFSSAMHAYIRQQISVLASNGRHCDARNPGRVKVHVFTSGRREPTLSTNSMQMQMRLARVTLI